VPDIDQMIASGDFVVSRYTATGTHQGELGGLPATSRRVKVNVCTVNELRGERIVRSWVYWDSAHLLRQLGALP
jgi:predicted ester cyclase